MSNRSIVDPRTGKTVGAAKQAARRARLAGADGKNVVSALRAPKPQPIDPSTTAAYRAAVAMLPSRLNKGKKR